MTLFDRLKQILVPKLKNNPGQEDSNGNFSAHGYKLNLTEDAKQKNIAHLTPREHDLYLLLLEGFTLKESAKQLSIKYSTANTHMTGIYKKLNVNSRAGLIINYREIGGKI